MAAPTLRRARTLTAIVAVFVLAFAGYGIYLLVAGEAVEPAIRVYSASEQVEQARGVVELGLGSGREAQWVVIGPAGDETALGSGSRVTWDTGAGPNGVYTVRASTASATYSREIDVMNQRRDAGTTAAVVGTATVIATGGSALTASVANQMTSATVHVAKNTLLALGEDHLAVRTAGKRRFMPSKLALAVTMVLVFLFFAFEGLGSLDAASYLAALPVVGGVAAAFVAAALGVEALLAYAGRAAARVRFLLSGAVTLVVSSVALRTPFGYPGYIDEDDDGEDDLSAASEAIRAFGSIVILLGLVLPFLWLGRLWRADILEVATEISIVTFATTAFPMRPMPGNDIWRWRRSAAFALVVGAYALYFAFQLGHLSMGLLELLAWLSIAGYVAVFVYLRGVSAPVTPPWLVGLRAGIAGARDAFAAFSPRTVLRGLQAISRLSRGAGRSVDRGLQGAWRGFHAVVKPMTAKIAARQQAAAERRATAAEGRFLAEASGLLAGMDDLPDDTTILVRHTGQSLRLGDLREAVAAIETARSARAGEA